MQADLRCTCPEESHATNFRLYHDSTELCRDVENLVGNIEAVPFFLRKALVESSHGASVWTLIMRTIAGRRYATYLSIFL
jgi:hypothetical protein